MTTSNYREIFEAIKTQATGSLNTRYMATEALRRAGYDEDLSNDLYVLAHQTLVKMAGSVLGAKKRRNNGQGELFILDDWYPIDGEDDWQPLESFTNKKDGYALAAKFFRLGSSYTAHGNDATKRWLRIMRIRLRCASITGGKNVPSPQFCCR